jgi:hypothetical protein
MVEVSLNVNATRAKIRGLPVLKVEVMQVSIARTMLGAKLIPMVKQLMTVHVDLITVFKKEILLENC